MSNENSLGEFALDEIRQRIDKVDSQLIKFLTKRSELVEVVASIKCHQNLPIYDNARENKIIEKVTVNNPTRYQAVDMASIFHAILRAGLNQQLLFRSEHKE